MEKQINNLPVGVKIISIAIIILSIILISIGIFLIINSFNGTGVSFKGLPIGIMLLLPSIIALFLSVFTLKKKNWARIALGIFTLLGGGFLLGSIQFIFLMFVFSASNYNQETLNFFDYIRGPTKIIILGLIIFVFWYLIFNKRVKDFFSKKQ